MPIRATLRKLPAAAGTIDAGAYAAVECAIARIQGTITIRMLITGTIRAITATALGSSIITMDSVMATDTITGIIRDETTPG